MRRLMAAVIAALLSTNPLNGGDNSVEIRTKGTSTSIAIDQVGYSNTARVWCGLSEGTYQTHTCSSATMTIDQDGYGNLAKAYSQYTNHTQNRYTISQDGESNTAYIDMDEDSNDSTITQTGDDLYGEIYMSGDNTVYTIEQTGDDHFAKMYALGSNSDWTITQSGTGTHNALIKSCNNCNNNDATIEQSGAGSHDGDIDFKTNPADNNTVALTQSGSGSHVGNIILKQGSYTVNATQSGAIAKGYSVTLDCTGSCTKTITVTQSD